MRVPLLDAQQRSLEVERPPKHFKLTSEWHPKYRYVLWVTPILGARGLVAAFQAMRPAHPSNPEGCGTHALVSDLRRQLRNGA